MMYFQVAAKAEIVDHRRRAKKRKHHIEEADKAEMVVSAGGKKRVGFA